jgi:hypothetical protein
MRIVDEIEPSPVRLLLDDLGRLATYRNRLPVWTSPGQVPLRAHESDVAGSNRGDGLHRHPALDGEESL